MNESVYGVVELIGSSSESWEQAAENAVREAAANHPDLRVADRGRRGHRISHQDAAQLQARRRLRGTGAGWPYPDAP